MWTTRPCSVIACGCANTTRLVPFPWRRTHPFEHVFDQNVQHATIKCGARMAPGGTHKGQQPIGNSCDFLNHDDPNFFFRVGLVSWKLGEVCVQGTKNCPKSTSNSCCHLPPTFNFLETMSPFESPDGRFSRHLTLLDTGHHGHHFWLNALIQHGGTACCLTTPLLRVKLMLWCPFQGLQMALFDVFPIIAISVARRWQHLQDCFFVLRVLSWHSDTHRASYLKRNEGCARDGVRNVTLSMEVYLVNFWHVEGEADDHVGTAHEHSFVQLDAEELYKTCRVRYIHTHAKLFFFKQGCMWWTWLTLTHCVCWLCALFFTWLWRRCALLWPPSYFLCHWQCLCSWFILFLLLMLLSCDVFCVLFFCSGCYSPCCVRVCGQPCCTASLSVRITQRSQDDPCDACTTQFRQCTNVC